jgi:negative regulator of replication initiation
MKRTQIYIDEGTYKYLREESKITGKTMSEIIRESIKSRISAKADEILKRTDDVYGIWKNRKIEVQKHIRELRRDRKIW